ncbi:MAG: hypothetical protein RID07_01240 [Lacipirellulaceae bacterium]
MLASIVLLGMIVEVTVGRKYFRGEQAPEKCYVCPIFATGEQANCPAGEDCQRCNGEQCQTESPESAIE